MASLPTSSMVSYPSNTTTKPSPSAATDCTTALYLQRDGGRSDEQGVAETTTACADWPGWNEQAVRVQADAAGQTSMACQQLGLTATFDIFFSVVERAGEKKGRPLPVAVATVQCLALGPDRPGSRALPSKRCTLLRVPDLLSHLRWQ